ncbi:TRAP transporter small permease [Uliginosibacterium sp. sgz301328]|uniref:TRAP transporter small permease n=1 Tax=Uliginosibacterium sp. sgz301328 TaxID=3243764 RepID=UPI00359E1FD7
MSTTCRALANGFYRLLEAILVICMVTMFVLVFGNVILRFFFNSGFDIAEELPRFMFVLMTFLGATVAMRDRTHISVNIVLSRLSIPARRVCWGICQVLILICACYMLYSSYLQHEIVRETLSPVMMISMLWVYGVSYIAGAAIGLHALANLLRLACGRVADDELMTVSEEGSATHGPAEAQS